MCVIEAVTGGRSWGLKDEVIVRILKVTWAPEDINNGSGPDCPQRDARHLAWRMCCQDPSKRLSISSVRYELEQFSMKDNCNLSQPEQERSCSFDEYDSGRMKGLWLKLLAHMEKWDHIQYHQAFDELKKIRELLQDSTCDPTFFGRFHTLLIEFYQMIKMSPEQARMMHLTSTRVTSNSLYAFQWRVNSLMASLGEAPEAEKKREERWHEQRKDQIEGFVTGVSDTFLLLKDLKSLEERSLFLRNLKTELEDPQGKYTADQRAVMEKVHKEIARMLEREGDSDLVVVKRLDLAGSSTNFDTSISDFSLSTLSVLADPTVSEAAVKSTKREEALKMFRREVDIWFGFSHPHVIQLFGACHVGRPFFVCEYATNGTLVSYLRKNPDQLWAKLHEAALGVQYLHARGVVHSDLKGNNIVIGSDFKAKVTDFGLSSIESSEAQPLVSAAWHWLAPECFSAANTRPTSASDVYSLGMCIVEALRVVEAARAGKDTQFHLPWRVADRNAVKYHAVRGELPYKLTICDNNQWDLIKRMCALNPEERIKISTVVDEFDTLANASIGNQTENYIETSAIGSVESVSRAISEAREMLVRPQGSTDRRDAVLSLYVSLWDSLEEVKVQLTKSLLPNVGLSSAD
ncbi:hypothetical protein PC110_g12403 [Phytophthora cactorum]|uniref:Protein kinase domain-containing protein n=1 Tax=Phytophthora cactorum TaxID=29920 RepID=A0A329S400_9STRA|nr:hypothetical protein PC110_g12403 [Phytophthora cactorum]